MSIPDQIVKVKDMDLLLSRVVAIQRVDDFNSSFQLKVYLVSDSIYIFDFNHLPERDAAYRNLFTSWQTFIDSQKQ